MSKVKQIFTSARMIILICFLLFAVVAISPHPTLEGVAIRSVAPNSSAEFAGMTSPSPKVLPVDREVIINMNNQKVRNTQDYEAILASLPENASLSVETTEGYYLLDTQYKLGLGVYDAPTTNIRKGLDLEGGTSVLLQPEEALSAEDMDALVQSLEERINVFGLSDVTVRQSSDLSGNRYILVEVAGANENEVIDLVSSQGKFEAKIANQTVFEGGQDITYVCRSAQCSGLDPNYGCQGSPGSYACRYMFSISLSPAAARRQADATAPLSVETDASGSRYLSEDIILYLDDKQVDSLRIAESLKGRPVTDISISGTGAGASEQLASLNAIDDMKRMQTILITGSLPVKLNIVRTESIPAELGDAFLNNALMMGLLAILSVALVVLARYRSFKIALPMVFAMLSELILLLGFAALMRWQLDLAAIAGILIAIGTGVDDQIVIVDETLNNKDEKGGSWAQQLKKAFFIIFAAYATTMVAMGPLWLAGAGIVKGFAATTMTGVTFGVLITRPAFASIVRVLLDR